MINEQMLLDYIQKPFDLGHKTRQILHTKFLHFKEFVVSFIEESGSSIEACQRVGERVGRFLGWVIGLGFTYVIVPGIAMGAIMVMRGLQRGKVRWDNIRTWVTAPAADPQDLSTLASDSVSPESMPNPFDSTSFAQEVDNAGEMVALPPCDQPAPNESPLSRSVSFVQQTASDLPQTLSPKGIKTAYVKAKRKTQHNPMLTGLVTAGFTAISFFAIQLDPAKEAAIASHHAQPNAEEVTLLDSPQDYSDLDRDLNAMN